MFHLDRPMYLLGYLANQSKVYLIDKEFNVIGYTLLLTLIEYKTLVMRGDLERASAILPSIPKEHHNSVAHFLESRGMIEEALEVATDPDYRFDLAIQLGKLEIAKDIALVAQSESKWKQLGELAMSNGLLDMAEDCLKHANDLTGLLLLYSSLGDAEGIIKLASLAKENGKNNVAFACLFMLGKLEDCLQLLVDSNRIPAAALMARSYLPNKVSEIVALWRKDLNKVNQKAAESLVDTEEYSNMFEDWQIALEVEARAAETRVNYPPATEYVNYVDRSHVNLVEVFKNMQLDDEEPYENGELDHDKLIIFGGVGIACLPPSLIFAFIRRPKAVITRSQYIKEATELGKKARELKKAADALHQEERSGSKGRKWRKNMKAIEKELLLLEVDVNALEEMYPQGEKVIAKPGSVETYTKFEEEIYVLTEDEDGRTTAFISNYRPQFYLRTADVTRKVDLLEIVKMVLIEDEGGHPTAFISNYRPQFYLRTADVTRKVDLLEIVKMVMRGDSDIAAFELTTPVVLEPGN